MASKPRVTAPEQKTGNVVRDSSLALVPETLDPYLAVNALIWLGGPLNAAEIEIARLRNARTVNCVFCRNVRYDIAIEAGLDESKVAMIEDGFIDSALSDREKLILEFTDQYLGNPAAIGTDLQQRLLAEFTTAELVHLSMAISHFHGFSRCAVSLGGMPDDMPRMEVSLPD
ncbi:carboxymuconolactone decarboxylase family protein [Halieaceae bacterium IMCC14734]|uniref:Carboxymuconolactone decarboxylase family protein n=1 Tax=Candidatus Litorirhabdus singularis TaxID=2518993 RepID=A0ABT3TF40_9GAMM|nr:carboxymuconolactone decarboxylase family protein [Candidatus Litorirhabdus singularis]MCX2980935.1 carboxymuconolactone decarboxylase family protein [Candidatus Litorirhabdus singularis]